MQRTWNESGVPPQDNQSESTHSESLIHRTVRTALATASLPAIATLDWCERAAGVLAGLQHGAVAGVVLARITDQGDISECEAAGVACSPATMTDAMSGVLSELRWRLESMSNLGWKPGQAIDEMGQRGGQLSQMSIKDWNVTESGRAFLPVAPSELYVGVVDIGSKAPSFRLAAWLAHPASKPPVIGMTDVFLAILQRIGDAATHAIGSGDAERSVWITAKEKQVLDRLIIGLCVREIASELGRSVHTVHDHVKSLHRKLGAVSRGDLIARALGYQRSAEYAERNTKPIAFELKKRFDLPSRPPAIASMLNSHADTDRQGEDGGVSRSGESVLD